MDLVEKYLGETKATYATVEPKMVDDLKKVAKQSGLFTIKTKKLKGSSFVDVYVQTKNMQAAIELNDPKKQWKGAIADIKKKYNYDPTKR